MATIKARSLGTKTAYTTGTIATDATGLIVTLTGGTFDTNWGEGDLLKINTDAAFDNSFSDDFDSETWVYVLSRDSATQLTLQTAVTPNQSGETYSIQRAYSTIAGWEAGAPASLVTDDSIWKGVCYNDSEFSGAVLITGITTDTTRYVWLTAAVGHRHSGQRYTTSGVRITHNYAYAAMFQVVSVPYTKLEYLQFRPSAGQAGIGANSGSVEQVTVSNCIVYYDNHQASSIYSPGITLTGGMSRAINCLVYAAATKALNYGISLSYGAAAYNCTVYGTVGGYVAGIALNTSNSSAYNNISIFINNRCFTNGGGSTNTSNNLSSDATALGANSLINKLAADQFTSLTAGSEDFTLKTTSPAVNAGVDLHTTFTNDIANKSRYASWINQWDIGASRPFTIITKSIGTTARDYSTIATWEASAPTSLVAEDIIWKGECYNDSVFSITSTITIAGITTDATRYIWLTAAAGHRHDGKKYTTSGVRLEEPTGVSAVSIISIADANIKIIIEYLQLSHYGNGNTVITQTGSTGGTIVRNNILFAPTSAFTGNIGLKLHGANDLAYNNLIYGSKFDTGILAYRCKMYNNTVHGCTLGISAPASYGTTISNNIAVGNTTDFSGTPGTASNNLSSDTTAPGTDSLISKAATDQFVSLVAGSEDFNLKAGSSAVRTGTNLSAYFVNDITNALRIDPWDIGAFKNMLGGWFLLQMRNELYHARNI